MYQSFLSLGYMGKFSVDYLILKCQHFPLMLFTIYSLAIDKKYFLLKVSYCRQMSQCCGFPSFFKTLLSLCAISSTTGKTFADQKACRLSKRGFSGCKELEIFAGWFVVLNTFSQRTISKIMLDWIGHILTSLKLCPSTPFVCYINFVSTLALTA